MDIQRWFSTSSQALACSPGVFLSTSHCPASRGPASGMPEVGTAKELVRTVLLAFSTILLIIVETTLFVKEIGSSVSSAGRPFASMSCVIIFYGHKGSKIPESFPCSLRVSGSSSQVFLCNPVNRPVHRGVPKVAHKARRGGARLWAATRARTNRCTARSHGTHGQVSGNP